MATLAVVVLQNSRARSGWNIYDDQRWGSQPRLLNNECHDQMPLCRMQQRMVGRVEDELKPLVVTLMNGESCVLDGTEQQTLALWMTKLHMLLAQFDVRFANVIPTEHLRNMRLESAPPSTYQVWIGKFDTDAPPVFSSEHHNIAYHKPDLNGAIRGHVHLTTLRFHQLLSQVYGYSDLDGEVHYLENGLGGRNDSKRIWPIGSQQCSWPPTASFNDSNFGIVRRMVTKAP